MASTYEWLFMHDFAQAGGRIGNGQKARVPKLAYKSKQNILDKYITNFKTQQKNAGLEIGNYSISDLKTILDESKNSGLDGFMNKYNEEFEKSLADTRIDFSEIEKNLQISITGAGLTQDRIGHSSATTQAGRSAEYAGQLYRAVQEYIGLYIKTVAKSGADLGVHDLIKRFNSKYLQDEKGMPIDSKYLEYLGTATSISSEDQKGVDERSAKCLESLGNILDGLEALSSGTAARGVSAKSLATNNGSKKEFSKRGNTLADYKKLLLLCKSHFQILGGAVNETLSAGILQVMKGATAKAVNAIEKDLNSISKSADMTVVKVEGLNNTVTNVNSKLTKQDLQMIVTQDGVQMLLTPSVKARLSKSNFNLNGSKRNIGAMQMGSMSLKEIIDLVASDNAYKYFASRFSSALQPLRKEDFKSYNLATQSARIARVEENISGEEAEAKQAWETIRANAKGAAAMYLISGTGKIAKDAWGGLDFSSAININNRMYSTYSLLKSALYKQGTKSLAVHLNRGFATGDTELPTYAEGRAALRGSWNGKLPSHHDDYNKGMSAAIDSFYNTKYHIAINIGNLSSGAWKK